MIELGESRPADTFSFSQDSGGRLCLLVSRRCNLRCGFCQVEFTGQDMPWPTARAGIEHYFQSLKPGCPARIKFFGGEPMLNFPLIRSVIDAVSRIWGGQSARFELATNGIFLDEGRLEYFKRHPEVEIAVSRESWASARLPGVWITLVLEPKIQAPALLRRLANSWRLGYRGFNFLPAYYVDWNTVQLNELRRALGGAHRLLCELRGFDSALRVKNLELFSPVPLYNDAVTLDVDGTFYGSNIIQIHGTERYREKLRLGHVSYNPGFLRDVRRPSGEELRNMIAEWAGPKLWRSTLEADRVLTEFVDGFRFN